MILLLILRGIVAVYPAIPCDKGAPGRRRDGSWFQGMSVVGRALGRPVCCDLCAFECFFYFVFVTWRCAPSASAALRGPPPPPVVLSTL